MPGQVARTQAPPRRVRALAGQVAQVQRGGAALEQGVVPGGPAVTELEAPAAPGGDLGDDAFHLGPPGHVVRAQPGPAGAGGAQHVVARMQDELAAGLAGGAQRAQRAVAAHGAEGSDAGPAETGGVPGRAGDRAGLLIDGEVEGEPSLDRGRRGLGLITAWCPASAIAPRQVPGAIGAIAVPGKRFLPVTAVAGACPARLCRRRARLRPGRTARSRRPGTPQRRRGRSSPRRWP